MLDYIRELFNDKRTYTIFVATCAIAMVIVIFIIWWPKEDNQQFATYEDIDLETKYLETSKDYFNSLMFYIRYGQTDDVVSKISEDYVTYVGKNRTDIGDEIFSKKVKSFNNVNIYTRENTVVYSTTLVYEDGTTRRMNLVEPYPYIYSITFDDFYMYENTSKNVVINGIEFKFDKIYCAEKTKSYVISITNRENNRITIDLGNIKKAYLELENSEQYGLSNAIVSSDMENIQKGSTVNKEFTFSIPFDVQSKIEKIVFKDVKIDGTTKDIEIIL